jgi:phosphoribosylamine---glycine ligase
MKVLVIGSGGREHALAWKIKQSTKVDKLFAAPGNAGTAQLGENLAIGVNDFESIKKAVLEKGIGMVVVGPEDPLVNGIIDYFKNDKELANVKIIGPDKNAAQLEGSKEFAKDFMKKYDIPTAKYQSFTSETIQEAFDFLAELDAPYVLKADGLAAGKGVLILDDIEAAKNELKQMLGGKFGEASKKVVIEEFLSGIEVSVFVLTDGESYKILPEAKDYKRIGEGDTGLNTGGMGAVTPVEFADEVFMSKVEERIIKPTIEGIKKEKMDYKGFIFLGLININNEPFVIEYNVRMGDPETEVVIPRVKSDLFELLELLPDKKLSQGKIELDERTSTTVMLVSKGYPGSYEKGKEIVIGNADQDVVVFHAGTKPENGKVLSNGGRVIAVTAYGNSMKDALVKSYAMIEKIDFEGKTFRTDIGFDL